MEGGKAADHVCYTVLHATTGPGGNDYIHMLFLWIPFSLLKGTVQKDLFGCNSIYLKGKRCRDFQQILPIHFHVVSP